MAITVATPVKRSWAQIVEGDSKNAGSTQKSIKPAARGSLMRFCRGEVLTMLSHYGWLMLYGDVDHPSTEKHGGDVYIHKDDVVDGESLLPGDVVTFYLYVDEQGLGAEGCHLEQRSPSQLRTDAAEFVPMSAKLISESDGRGMRASAEEFVPAKAAPVIIDEVSDVFLRMSQVFDDDSDEEEQGAFESELDVVGSRLAQVFAAYDEDSDEEEYPNVELVSDDEAYASSEAPVSDDEHVIRKPWTSKHAPPSDGSTSAGETSDSEDENSLEMLAVIQKTLPLGVSLPPNFRPPPGLSLPSYHEEAWVF